MSLAIGSNPSSRRWNPIEEQPRITDERMRQIYQYYQQVRKDIPSKIHRYHFFIPGKQEYNEHFQRVFKECFARLRGASTIIEDTSKALACKFEYFLDVCIRTEIPLYYDEDTGSRPISIVRNPNPEFIKKLRSILESTDGLQKELLGLLEEEGKRLHPNVRADDENWRDFFEGDCMAIFRAIPKCSDTFRSILSQLLQLAWLQEQLGLIQIPTKAIASNVSRFRIGNLDYLVKKTNDDGACALHALLGEPIDGEYRYPGPGNVRELFIERLQEHVSTSPTIRTLVTKILYSHLDTLDGSSKMLFSGQTGEALMTSFLLMKTNVDQFIREKNEEESLIWQQQMAKPHIQKELLAATKTNMRYAGMNKETILQNLEEYPELILSLVNESPGDFLRLLESPVYWQIFNIRSQREECFSCESVSKKVFAMRHLYPHYLKIIKDPKYLFNTEELELAAIIFDKKMVAVRSFNDEMVPATKMINGTYAGDPIIIYHEGVHFSRCKPVEKSDAEEMLYQSAQEEADNLIEWDKKISDRLKSTARNETAQILVSGTVSLARKSPWLISGQLIKSVLNLFGTMADPFNERKSTELVKLAANSAGSWALGQAPIQVGTALAIDAFFTLNAPQEMTSIEQAQRNYGVSILKSIGGDEKELFRGFVGGCVSAASVFFTFQQKEGEGWGWTILKVLPTNSDFQNGLQDGLIKALTQQKKAALPPPTETPEEKQARESKEAKVQAIKKLTKTLREELTEIKEQGFDDAWVQDLVANLEQERKVKTPDPRLVKDDEIIQKINKENLDKVKQEIGKINHEIQQETQRFNDIQYEKRSLNQVIEVGDQNLKNFHSLGEFVDDAHYELKKEKKNWKIYRNGEQVFKSENRSSGEKEKCFREIPNLKKKYGTWKPSHIQETKEAEKALNIACEKKKSLENESSKAVEALKSKKNKRSYLLWEKSRLENPNKVRSFEPIIEVETIKPTQPPPKSKVVGMRDEPKYLELLALKGKKQSDLSTAKVDQTTKNKEYRAAGRTKEKRKRTDNPFKKIAYELKWDGINDDYYEKKDASDKADKNVIKLEAELVAINKAIDEASAPKDTPPSSSVPVVVDTFKDKKNHHLFYFDASGQKQDLGKYKTKEDAEFISGRFSNLIAEGKSDDFQCYDALMKAEAQGIPLKDLPNRPHFDMPTMLGNDASKNSDTISAASRGFKSKTKAFLEQVAGIVKQHEMPPIEPKGFTKGEIRELSQAIRPRIKDNPKEHGFCFKAWRKSLRGLDKAYDGTSKFLGKAGFSTHGRINLLTICSDETARTSGEAIVFHYSTNKSKPSRSTSSSYGETRHQIALQRGELQSNKSAGTAPIQSQLHVTLPSGVELKNPFVPQELRNLTPVSTPALPPTESPVHPEPTPVSNPQPKGLVSRILQAATNLTNANAAVEVGQRTRVAFFPQEQSSQISSITSFDPGLQTKYPEAYALATNLDQLGREKVTLLRVNMEELSSRNTPRVLKEFSDIAAFLEKGTGHSLYTPGIHPVTREPVAVRIEKIAVAAVSEARDVLQGYNRERIDNPLQSQADLILSLPRTGGRLAREFAKVINSLLRLRHPDDPVARTMDQKLDALAGFIDGNYVGMIHSFYPQYDPNSASSRIGNFVWEIVPAARAISAGRLAMRPALRAPMYKSIVTAEEAVGRRMAEQMAFLERINSPAYRSGIVGEGTVAKLAERNIQTINPVFRPGYCGPPTCKSLTSRHFFQAQEYGKGSGYKFLENGRTRYYGIIKPPRIEGNMIGTRVVREWDPITGLKRTWLETLDKNGTIRSIRLERNDGIKIHYIFDENGMFEGIR